MPIFSAQGDGLFFVVGFRTKPKRIVIYKIIAKICQRYAKDMPQVCQRYLRSKSEATNSRQLPKANICQIYAKDNYLMQSLSCQRYNIKEFVSDMPNICQRYATNSRQLP